MHRHLAGVPGDPFFPCSSGTTYMALIVPTIVVQLPGEIARPILKLQPYHRQSVQPLSPSANRQAQFLELMLGKLTP
jgi:hypothetical protein